MAHLNIHTYLVELDYMNVQLFRVAQVKKCHVSYKSVTCYSYELYIVLRARYAPIM